MRFLSCISGFLRLYSHEIFGQEAQVTSHSQIGASIFSIQFLGTKVSLLKLKLLMKVFSHVLKFDVFYTFEGCWVPLRMCILGEEKDKRFKLEACQFITPCPTKHFTLFTFKSVNRRFRLNEYRQSTYFKALRL